MQREVDVVIVGGGIVGLAAACRLSQIFSSVVVLERAPEPKPWKCPATHGLRVSALNLASVALLETLGIWQEISACRVYPYQSMVVWDQQFGGEIEFLATDTRHQQLGFIVENDLLQDALLNFCKASPRVSIYFDSEPHSLVMLRDCALLETGQGDRLEARLILAADGKHSQVRKLAGIDITRADYAQQGLVAVCQTENSHQDTAWQCFTAMGPLAMLPLSEKLCSMVWSVSTEQAKTFLQLARADFEHELSKPLFRQLGHIVLQTELASFPLQGMQANRYIADRVVLIGDAAHQVHPLAGQGLNLGLADVEYLAVLLSSTDRPPGSERLLRKYERARKSENEIMMHSFEWLDRLFRHSSKWAGMGRSIGIDTVNHLTPIKRLFMEKAIGVTL